MTPLQQLKEIIRKALPYLMELGVGCEIKSTSLENRCYKILNEIKEDEKLWYTLLEQSNNNILPNVYFDSLYFRNSIIIGRPITLPDVLQWLAKLNGQGTTICNVPLEHIYILDKWNLEKYTIDEQSEELIDLLSNLKKE